MKKEDIVVAKEVAEEAFEEWCDANGFESDEEDLSEDELLSFKINKKTIVKAIMAGRAVTDDEKITYTISNHSPEGFAGMKLEINAPTGRFWTAMDGFKSQDTQKKIISCMSELTGKDRKFFEKIHGFDFRFLQAVVIFFMNI